LSYALLKVSLSATHLLHSCKGSLKKRTAYTL